MRKTVWKGFGRKKSKDLSRQFPARIYEQHEGLQLG
jgi:hypothetical protein